MSKPRKRPTHTVLMPTTQVLPALADLLDAGCTFTCEPSPRDPGRIWFIGLLADGVAVINKRFGPTTDVGTLGEHYPGQFEAEGEPHEQPRPAE